MAKTKSTTTSNLISADMRSPEDRKRISSMGGIARQEKRKQNILLSQIALQMLSLPPSASDKKITNILKKQGIDDKNINEAYIMVHNLIQRSKTDTKSFEVVRDSIGQKPVDKQITEMNIELSPEQVYNRHFGNEE